MPFFRKTLNYWIICRNFINFCTLPKTLWTWTFRIMSRACVFILDSSLRFPMIFSMMVVYDIDFFLSNMTSSVNYGFLLSFMNHFSYNERLGNFLFDFTILLQDIVKYFFILSYWEYSSNWFLILVPYSKYSVPNPFIHESQ